MQCTRYFLLLLLLHFLLRPLLPGQVTGALLFLFLKQLCNLPALLDWSAALLHCLLLHLFSIANSRNSRNDRCFPLPFYLSTRC